MKQKMLAAGVGIAIIAIAGGFFGGYKYEQAHAASARGARAGQFGSGTGVGGTRTAGGFAGAARGGSLSGGKVIAKDDKTITVELQDGGSAIVLYSPTTSVMKSASGTIGDIAVGTQIIVTGPKNSDGSVTAQSIQIRPDMPARAASQQ